MDEGITVYEVKYFNIFTDTTYTVTTNKETTLKQFLNQLNSGGCILTLAGKTTTIREYTVDEYYPDETTLNMHMSQLDDTFLYLSDFMMEQASDIINGDIAYYVSLLPYIIERFVPFCRGTFKDKLMPIIVDMVRRVIIDSSDSCVDVIKGICSLELFLSHNERQEYPFNNGWEGD